MFCFKPAVFLDLLSKDLICWLFEHADWICAGGLYFAWFINHKHFVLLVWSYWCFQLLHLRVWINVKLLVPCFSVSSLTSVKHPNLCLRQRHYYYKHRSCAFYMYCTDCVYALLILERQVWLDFTSKAQFMCYCKYSAWLCSPILVF